MFAYTLKVKRPVLWIHRQCLGLGCTEEKHHSNDSMRASFHDHFPSREAFTEERKVGNDPGTTLDTDAEVLLQKCVINLS